MNYSTARGIEGYDDGKGPKQRVWRRLGLGECVSILFRVFLMLIQVSLQI
jgi:hypothetical protein